MQVLSNLAADAGTIQAHSQFSLKKYPFQYLADCDCDFMQLADCFPFETFKHCHKTESPLQAHWWMNPAALWSRWFLNLFTCSFCFSLFFVLVVIFCFWRNNTCYWSFFCAGTVSSLCAECDLDPDQPALHPPYHLPPPQAAQVPLSSP